MLNEYVQPSGQDHNIVTALDKGKTESTDAEKQVQISGETNPLYMT